MKSNPVDTGRRRATGLILASAALPVAGLLRPAIARAAELPHVTPDDPTAKALKYVDDASEADRPDKMGVAGDEQLCANCQFIQGADGEEWRPCMLFPGKAVNANGWCTSWTPKVPTG